MLNITHHERNTNQNYNEVSPHTCQNGCHQQEHNRTSLVAPWLKIRLPIQGTRVWSLVREDLTCCGATKPVHHNYWSLHTLEPAHCNYWSPHSLGPACHNYWTRMLQLLKPVCLEPVLHNKRSHLSEKPTHRNEEQPLLGTTRESPLAATKTQCSQKKI